MDDRIFCAAEEDLQSNVLIVPEGLLEMYLKEVIHSVCLPA
jgi:hypothetical protein